MAAVIHMFCTLQEAARRLRISEEQIETMLQRGILREFREGPHRLLRAADVALLAQTLGADPGPSPAETGQPPATTSDRKVRLPHCAAVTADTRERTLPRPKIAGQSQQGRMRGVQHATQRYRAEGERRTIERAPVPHYRPSSPAPELSIREWFWNGLTQDRPIAIFLLFGLAVLLLAAVVAGVYLAAQVL